MIRLLLSAALLLGSFPATALALEEQFKLPARAIELQLLYGMADEIKAALVQMTRMLAVEWAAYGIRVNAVAPGRLETPSPSRAEKGADRGYRDAMLARIPLHRLASAEEGAATVAYLVSPAAASMTGQVLVLDGGLTAA